MVVVAAAVVTVIWPTMNECDGDLGEVCWEAIWLDESEIEIEIEEMNLWALKDLNADLKMKRFLICSKWR
jgi:hypothetical protein